MGDRKALLRAVLEDPDDDGPRHVFADFLEESGDPAGVARAAFIRSQIAYAKLPDRCEREPDEALAGGLLDRPFTRPRCRCRVCTPRRAARNLYCRHWQEWCREALAAPFAAWQRQLQDETAGILSGPPRRPPTAEERLAERLAELLAPNPDGWLFSRETLTFRRGFAEAVSLPLAGWREWGESLVRAAPLREVDLSDRVPTTGWDRYGNVAARPGEHFWCRHDPAIGEEDDADELPSGIWDRLTGWRARDEFWAAFPSRSAAHAALSAAALAWAAGAG